MNPLSYMKNIRILIVKNIIHDIRSRSKRKREIYFNFKYFQYKIINYLLNRYRFIYKILYMLS